MVHIDEEALRSSLQRLRAAAYDADVVTVLTRTVNAVHEVFGYSGAGIMFITESGHLAYVAASDEGAPAARGGPGLKFRGEKALTPEAASKNALANLIVKRLELIDGHAAGEAGGDDGSGRGPADEIEIVAEQQILVAITIPELRFDDREKFEREHAANAAAIERENAFRKRIRSKMLFFGHWHCALLKKTTRWVVRTFVAYSRHHGP